MSHHEVILGLDAGTTVIKAVAFDSEGQTVALARRNPPLLVPKPGQAECDMNTLWELACQVLREVTDTLRVQGHRAVAMGVSGTMGGAWLVDRTGQPVRQAILWNDGRAGSYLQSWLRDGTLGRLFDLSCNACAPGFVLPVLRWLKDHEPDTLTRTSTVLFSKDWIRFKLTGVLATEESDASHAPGDVMTRSFSTHALELCGLSDLERLFPPAMESGDIAGRITPQAADATGLEVNMPVVAGLADVSATLLGAGCDRPGMAVSIAGTSLLNCLTTAQPLFEPCGVGVSFLLPGKLHARAMPNQTGALAVSWFAREFVGHSDPQHLETLVQQSPPGARGIVFHPYLNSTGVLAPVYEPRARGRFWGLGIEHNQSDLLRAVYEGVAMSMADCYGVLPAMAPPLRLVGGLANSPLWQQLFADVTGMPIATLHSSEAGALGVAMLAGVAAGVWPDLSQAVSTCCRIARVTHPDASRHAFYAGRLKLYQRLREHLTQECDLFEEIHGCNRN